MTPNRFDPDETDLTVEELLLERNGKTKTVNDVFKVVVASHHDAKKRDAQILALVEEVEDKVDNHLQNDVRMTHGEFEEFMRPFQKCIEVHKPNSNIDEPSVDEEEWELRKAWRFMKWVVLAAGGAFVVAVGSELSNLIFGG